MRKVLASALISVVALLAAPPASADPTPSPGPTDPCLAAGLTRQGGIWVGTPEQIEAAEKMGCEMTIQP